MTTRQLLPTMLALAVLLAGAPAPAEDRRTAQVAAVDGAIDVTPAPAREATPPERPRGASALPRAAQSEAWRAGARPPRDVPAVIVVRAALRKPADGARARPPEAPVIIEIVWHAPGT